MIRFTVPSAELVCRVPKTLWPDSAAVMAAWIADEDDVGVHTKGPADGLGEVGHVDPDLALVDQALLVFVVVFDRVFDRDDVPVHVVVNPVDHRRQGGRLARPGRPGDEDQPAGALDQLFHDRRQADLLEREELVGNSPEHQTNIATLLEDRDPEPRGFAKGESEVSPAHLLQLLLAPLGRDTLHQGRGVGTLEHLGFEGDHVATQPEHRLRADGQVQVARLLRDDRLEQLVDQQRSHGRLKPLARSPSSTLPKSRAG
jgi:hypothetical protein